MPNPTRRSDATPPQIADGAGSAEAPGGPPARVEDAPATPLRKPLLKLQKNSIVRKKALAIVALRAAGYSDAAIASELKIAVTTIKAYLYRATQAGMLVDKKTKSLLSDPTDRVEFELSHKVIRNLNEMMDSDDDQLRKEVTLEVAKGALFKKFDPIKEHVLPSMNVLSVKIEMPSSGAVEVRPGALGGTPAYVEGEVASDRGDNEF